MRFLFNMGVVICLMIRKNNLFDDLLCHLELNKEKIFELLKIQIFLNCSNELSSKIYCRNDFTLLIHNAKKVPIFYPYSAASSFESLKKQILKWSRAKKCTQCARCTYDVQCVWHYQRLIFDSSKKRSFLMRHPCFMLLGLKIIWHVPNQGVIKCLILDCCQQCLDKVYRHIKTDSKDAF